MKTGQTLLLALRAYYVRSRVSPLSQSRQHAELSKTALNALRILYCSLLEHVLLRLYLSGCDCRVFLALHEVYKFSDNAFILLFNQLFTCSCLLSLLDSLALTTKLITA